MRGTAESYDVLLFLLPFLFVKVTAGCKSIKGRDASVLGFFVFFSNFSTFVCLFSCLFVLFFFFLSFVSLKTLVVPRCHVDAVGST